MISHFGSNMSVIKSQRISRKKLLPPSSWWWTKGGQPNRLRANIWSRAEQILLDLPILRHWMDVDDLIRWNRPWIIFIAPQPNWPLNENPNCHRTSCWHSFPLIRKRRRRTLDLIAACQQSQDHCQSKLAFSKKETSAALIGSQYSRYVEVSMTKHLSHAH